MKQIAFILFVLATLCGNSHQWGVPLSGISHQHYERAPEPKIPTYEEVLREQFERNCTARLKSQYTAVKTENLQALFVLINQSPFSVNRSHGIGNLLLNRYGDFVKGTRRYDLYLRSSPTKKCLETLQNVVKRIWPHMSDAHVYHLPGPIDKLLYNKPMCPIADEVESKALNDSQIMKYYQDASIQELLDYVNVMTALPLAPPSLDNISLNETSEDELDELYEKENFKRDVGMNRSNVFSKSAVINKTDSQKTNLDSMNEIIDVYKLIQAKLSFGEEMPSWTVSNNTYERMGHVFTKYLTFRYSNKESLRFRAGPLFQELIRAIQKQSQLMSPKVFLYATHEEKLASLLFALGKSLYQVPAHAASIIFEVHRTNIGEDYEIRAFYVGETDKEPYKIDALPLDACMGLSDYRCMFSKLVPSLEQYLNVKWSKECGIVNESLDPIQMAEEHLELE